MDIVQRNGLAAVGAILSVLAALFLANSLAPAEATALLQEGGPVELVTSVLHFVVAGLAFVLWGWRGGLFGLLGIGALAMGARELDLDKAFTTHGLFSTKEYFRATVPLVEKLLASAAVLLLAVLTFRLLRASLPALRSLAGQRMPAFWSIATVLAMLPLLKAVDALPRLARENGMAFGPDGLARLLAIEEIGELALPLLVLLVLVQLAAPVPARPGQAGVPVHGHPVPEPSGHR